MKKTILTFLLLACALFGFAQNNHVITGAEYFRDRNYTRAFEEFSKGAQQGDTYSQFFVVFLTYAGVGTPQNIDKALSLIGKYAQTNEEMCEFASAFYAGEKWSFTYMGERLSTDDLDVGSMRKQDFKKSLRFADLYAKKHHGDLTDVLSNIKGYCYLRGEGGLSQDYTKAFDYLANGLDYSNLITYDAAVDEYLSEGRTIASLRDRGNKLKSLLHDPTTNQLADIDRKVDQGVNRLVDNWMNANKNNINQAYLNCEPGMKSIIDQRFNNSVNEALGDINANNVRLKSPSTLEQAARSMRTICERTSITSQNQTAKELWTVLSLWEAYNKADKKWSNFESVFASKMFCPDIFKGVTTCELLPDVPDVVDVNIRQIKQAVEQSGLKQYDHRSVDALHSLANNETPTDNYSSALKSLQARCKALEDYYPSNGLYQLSGKILPLQPGTELYNRYHDRSLSSGNVVEYEALLKDYNDCVKNANSDAMKGDIELLTMLSDYGGYSEKKVSSYLRKYPNSPYADFLNDVYAMSRINALNKNSSRSEVNAVLDLPMSKSVAEQAKQKAKSIASAKRNGFHVFTAGLYGAAAMDMMLFDNYKPLLMGLGYGGGLALEARFSNVVGIRVEGEYFVRHYKETQKVYDNSAVGEAERGVSLNQINIPVMLTFNPNAPLVWDLGVQYSLCRGGKKVDEIGNTFEGTEAMSPDEYNSNLLSVIAGFRNQSRYVFWGIRGEYCFNNLLNNNFMLDPSEVEVGNAHGFAIRVMFGVQF